MKCDNKSSCDTCANKQNYDGVDRCSRYHSSLCKYVYQNCKADFYMDINDGVSLYAMRDWLNRLTAEELQLPLLFEESNQKMLPLAVLRVIDKNGDHWCFYAKKK